MREETHQPRLEGLPYDDLDDALNALVQALGGFKKVGPQLWPALPFEDASQRLRHCLNKSRREKLSHHETLALLRMGRAANEHAAKHFLDEATGYARSLPLDPQDELATLQRAYIDSVQNLGAIAARMERLMRTPFAVAGGKTA